jgi:hypothetical protein
MLGLMTLIAVLGACGARTVVPVPVDAAADVIVDAASDGAGGDALATTSSTGAGTSGVYDAGATR